METGAFQLPVVAVASCKILRSSQLVQIRKVWSEATMNSSLILVATTQFNTV